MFMETIRGKTRQGLKGLGVQLLALVSCKQGCGRFLGIESGEKKEVEIKG